MLISDMAACQGELFLSLLKNLLSVIILFESSEDISMVIDHVCLSIHLFEQLP